MIGKMLRIERSPLSHRMACHDMIEFVKVPHEGPIEVKNDSKKKKRKNKYKYWGVFADFELHKVYSIKSGRVVAYRKK